MELPISEIDSQSKSNETGAEPALHLNRYVGQVLRAEFSRGILPILTIRGALVSCLLNVRALCIQ